jgi:hypothetical protein
MVEITISKNHDYTGDSDDPFANFRLVEAVGVTTPEVGFLTRMLDKFARINSFVRKGILKVKDEKIEDTLLDLANYCILFAAFIKSKKDSGRSIDCEEGGNPTPPSWVHQLQPPFSVL